MFKTVLQAFKKSTINPDGREVLDPTPVEIPLGYQRPATLQEQIARLMAAEDFKRAMRARGQETFEEANDFEVGDDYDPKSPWEEEFHGQFEHEVNMERKLAEKERKAKEAPGTKEPKKAPQKPVKGESEAADGADD